MITIYVFPLAIGQTAMFARTFEREVDAADYENYWRNLGSCHVRRA